MSLCDSLVVYKAAVESLVLAKVQLEKLTGRVDRIQMYAKVQPNSTHTLPLAFATA